MNNTLFNYCACENSVHDEESDPEEERNSFTICPKC